MKENVPAALPSAGYYRLARGLHLAADYVVCDYPLRVVRPGDVAMRLLRHCQDERTPAELSNLLHLPPQRVQRLCEQLRWNWLLVAGPPTPREEWPGVSIIIPSYNRAAQLERCLHSLAQVDYPADCLEVIVVDDASSDSTGTLVAQLAQEWAFQDRRLHYVRHTRRLGAAQGRNSGAELARFALLAFIDSDCIAPPDWLRQLAPAFADARVGAVGGMIRAYDTRSLLGRYEDVHSSLYMGQHAQQIKLDGPLSYLPTANLLVRGSLWERIGGFAQLTHGEDVDFCRRLLESGSTIYYLPQGIILHDYRTDLVGFSRTRMAYASSEAALLQRHPATRRTLILPPEQATFAGLTLGGLWMTLRRMPFVGILGGCGAVLLTAFSARKRIGAVREQRVIINPLVVLRATLRGHLAYTYHFCRHITRYYTLPLLVISVMLPPLLLLLLVLVGVVTGVDYARLRPRMSLGQFVLCSLLDDCAYEIGVALGSIKQKTWKPLLPVVKRKLKARTPGL